MVSVDKFPQSWVITVSEKIKNMIEEYMITELKLLHALQEAHLTKFKAICECGLSRNRSISDRKRIE